MNKITINSILLAILASCVQLNAGLSDEPISWYKNFGSKGIKLPDGSGKKITTEMLSNKFDKKVYLINLPCNKQEGPYCGPHSYQNALALEVHENLETVDKILNSQGQQNLIEQNKEELIELRKKWSSSEKGAHWMGDMEALRLQKKEKITALFDVLVFTENTNTLQYKYQNTTETPAPKTYIQERLTEEKSITCMISIRENHLSKGHFIAVKVEKLEDGLAFLYADSLPGHVPEERLKKLFAKIIEDAYGKQKPVYKGDFSKYKNLIDRIENPYEHNKALKNYISKENYDSLTKHISEAKKKRERQKKDYLKHYKTLLSPKYTPKEYESEEELYGKPELTFPQLKEEEINETSFPKVKSQKQKFIIETTHPKRQITKRKKKKQTKKKSTQKTQKKRRRRRKKLKK